MCFEFRVIRSNVKPTAGRSNGDRAVPHSGERGETDVFPLVEGERVVLGARACQRGPPAKGTCTETQAYHFIRYDHEVEFFREGCDLFELFSGEHLPYGVMRRVQQDHFGAGTQSSAREYV